MAATVVECALERDFSKVIDDALVDEQIGESGFSVRWLLNTLTQNHPSFGQELRGSRIKEVTRYSS